MNYIELIQFDYLCFAVKINLSPDKHTKMSEWVDLYTNDLYNWAYYKTSNSDLSQDLVQDTFLAAWKNLDGFQENSKPLTWFKSILNNKIIDHYRKNAKVVIEPIDVIQNSHENHSEGIFNEKGIWNSNMRASWENETNLLDNLEFKKVLDHCLESLPENLKLAVLSKYIFEKKAETICQELNISPTNYWQLIHRAKMKLKKCLDANWSHQVV
jgi:RNA polymerase sigma-70 factor (ECF subfamily)